MRILSSGRYAAVTSTLALVVALGGTSYAASKISGHDIKNGTVTSADVKDKTLRMRDLAPSTTKSLKGATGPAGPRGAAGPAGTASRVVAVSRNADADFPDGGGDATFTLPLPAGSYVVTASMPASIAKGATGADLSCNLRPSLDERDMTRDTDFADSGASSGSYLSTHTQIAGTLANDGGGVSLICNGSSVSLMGYSIIATQVGAVDVSHG